MLSRKKVNEGYGQGSQGKIDAPSGVSILLKTAANTMSTMHWQMALITYLRGTSQAIRKGDFYFFSRYDYISYLLTLRVEGHNKHELV